MLKFRTLYNQAVQHSASTVASLFLFLALLILFQSIFTPTIVISFLILVGVLVLTVARPLWTLGFLAVYLPFESLVLKFVPDESDYL